MSWDGYIDNLIAQSKDGAGTAHCDKACIIGLDGGAAWTTAEHPNAFKLSAAESANIARAMKSKDYSSFQSSGIYVESEKYQYLREQGNLVLGKKKDLGSISIQCSKTAVVVGHTIEGSQQGNVNKAVGVIADYLESMNM